MTALAASATLSAAAANVGRTPAQDRDYAILATDVFVILRALAASRTLTLPPAARYTLGRALVIQDVSGVADAYPLTIAAAAGDSIDGQGAIGLASRYGGIELRPADVNVWTYR